MSNILFFARKLSQGKYQLGAGRLIALSLVGIALSVAIMLISLSVILGFKEQVSSLAYSQTGQLSLFRYGYSWTNTEAHISMPQATADYLSTQDEVEHLAGIIQQSTLIKTEDNYSAQIVYGVEDSFRGTDFASFLDSKTLNALYADSIKRPIILPQEQAQRLNLEIGAKVYLYFMGDKIRLRPFTLVGVYQLGGGDKLPALCRAESLRSLQGLEADSYSRILIKLKAGEDPRATAEAFYQRFSGVTIPMDNYTLMAGDDLMPDVFSWLELLDSNVVFLSVVILLIGIFTMATTVMILVLDKTRHIGVLKALGANDTFVRKVFSLIALRLIALGLCLGNIVALSLLLVQDTWHIIKLNPKDYFMDTVPVSLNLGLWIALNIGVFVVITGSIVFPTKIITSIRPSAVLRFE